MAAKVRISPNGQWGENIVCVETDANESLRMLYSIFLNDLTGLMERTIHEQRFPKGV